jgi:putative endonuclease
MANPDRPVGGGAANAGHDPRRRLGTLGEELAATYLLSQGFSLLDRNVRTRRGEIDLIAFDGDVLVFAEVKTRRLAAQQRQIRADQQPLIGLSARQRARLRSLAAAWLSQRRARPTAHTLRFDAIGVVLDDRDRLLQLQHVEAAW